MMNNNAELKNARAKVVTRKNTYRNNADNSVTITVSDGYDNILREETFTREDMIDLANEFTNKLVAKDQRKESRNRHVEGFETFCKYIGAYFVGYTGGILAVKAIKKIASIIKR